MGNVADVDERERILQAAATVWRDDPALPLDDVARLAGVSRATVYRHTGGRRALLAALGAPPEEDARARILAAASRVVFGEGVQRATIARIAGEAGVTPVTVYRLFGDRAGLFAAVAEQGTARRAGERLRLAPTGDVRKDLLGFAREILVFLRDHRGAFRNALAAKDDAPDLIAAVQQHRHTRTIDHVARYLEEQSAAGRLPRVSEPRRTAIALFGILAGFAFIAPSLDIAELHDVEGTAAFAIDLLLAGLRPGDAHG